MLITLMLVVTLARSPCSPCSPPSGCRSARPRRRTTASRHAYMRAIQHFYKKFNRYPTRIEELENTNNLRFLRKRYKDPVNRDAEGKEKDFKFLHHAGHRPEQRSGTWADTRPGPTASGPRIRRQAHSGQDSAGGLPVQQSGRIAGSNGRIQQHSRRSGPQPRLPRTAIPATTKPGCVPDLPAQFDSGSSSGLQRTALVSNGRLRRRPDSWASPAPAKQKTVRVFFKRIITTIGSSSTFQWLTAAARGLLDRTGRLRHATRDRETRTASLIPGPSSPDGHSGPTTAPTGRARQRRNRRRANPRSQSSGLRNEQ